MESDSVDALFAKISKLENEQNHLNEKLSKIELEIENKKTEELTKFWSKENKKDENLIKQLNDFKEKIKNQLEIKTIDYTFKYIPFDLSYTNIFISGDFNNWDMTEMEKDYSTDEEKFCYKINLEKGYEYAYCFFSNGERLIDFNQPAKSISYKDNQEYNYINIPDDKGKFIPFNKKQNSKENKDNNTLVKIKGNEKEFANNVFLLNDLIYQKKVELMNQKRNYITEINSKYNSSKLESKEDFEKTYNRFMSLFKERIIVYENTNYIIHNLDMRNRVIKAIRLYDPNGIKVNIKEQQKNNYYNEIPLINIFTTSYILSKMESDIIKKDQEKDYSNYLKILYQLQPDIYNPRDKELIPYRIEPPNVDINQYDLEIKDNLIKTVRHKQSLSYIMFESVNVGDGQKAGLVANDPIKVYTTLYNKDILNILHIHLNDTSQEITIDSEFLENNEEILNHKIFTTDVSGRRLTYKLIFKQYKLIKIYYCMSIDFIDEPPFQEIKFSPNGYVKIAKGEFKNYYGKIKQFPIGMLARKDNEETELKKMKSFGEKKEGYCGDRHLDGLPGFVLIEIMFYPGDEIKEIKDYIKRSLPVCHLIPLSPKEQIRFEKSIVIQNNSEVMNYYNDAKELEKYLNNQKLLDALNLDKIKEILVMAEKINPDVKNLEDDLVDKIKFAVEIKAKIIPILQQRIRLLVFSSKK